MNELLHDMMREMRIRWKYHTVSRLLNNMFLFAAIVGAFTIDHTFARYLLLFICNSMGFMFSEASEADRRPPVSDKNIQKKAIWMAVYKALKVCFYMMVGMFLENKSLVLTSDDYLFALMCFMLTTSWGTGAARVFHTGKAYDETISLSQLISAAADLAVYILAFIAILYIFVAREPFSHINQAAWKTVYAVLTVLFALALVDDLRPWKFADLEKEDASDLAVRKRFSLHRDEGGIA